MESFQTMENNKQQTDGDEAQTTTNILSLNYIEKWSKLTGDSGLHLD